MSVYVEIFKAHNMYINGLITKEEFHNVLKKYDLYTTYLEMLKKESKVKL